MSALFVALLAASPLVSASHHILGRQATTTSLAVGDNPDNCFYPPGLQTPTNYPSPPADLQSFLYTATDACDLNTAPATITSEYSSWTSAYKSWVTANSASLLSLQSYVLSYESSIATQQQCTQYYGTYTDNIETTSSYESTLLFPTDGVYGTCSTGTSTGAAAASTTASSGSVASSANLPSNSISVSSSLSVSGAGSTTPAKTGLPSGASIVSSATTAATSSGTGAAVPAFRADGAVSTYFLIAGISVAISAFVGMIAL